MKLEVWSLEFGVWSFGIEIVVHSLFKIQSSDVYLIFMNINRVVTVGIRNSCNDHSSSIRVVRSSLGRNLISTVALSGLTRPFMQFI